MRTPLAAVVMLSLAHVARADGTCATREACRTEAGRILARFADADSVLPGALPLAVRFDGVLDAGCRLGDADACRIRIQLHVARATLRDAQGERVRDRMTGATGTVFDTTFEPRRSAAIVDQTFARLRVLERERVSREDTTAAYEAFLAEFPGDEMQARFSRRIAELGLAEAVAASRASGSLAVLIDFCDRVQVDELTEPAFYEEVAARGGLADVEAYLRRARAMQPPPRDHIARVEARRMTIRFEAAMRDESQAAFSTLVALVREAPTGPYAERLVVRAIERRGDVDAAGFVAATVDVLETVAPPSRVRLADALADALPGLPAERSAAIAGRVAPSTSSAGRQRLVAYAVELARRGQGFGTLLAVFEAVPTDSSVESATFQALLVSADVDAMARYHRAGTGRGAPPDHLEAVRERVRTVGYERAFERSAREGYDPLVVAVASDPHHPTAARAVEEIARLTRVAAPAPAYEALHALRGDVPPGLRARVSELCAALLLRMDRAQRWAAYGNQLQTLRFLLADVSLGTRQQLAASVFADLTIPDGIGGVRMLRDLAAFFPGTQVAREAAREADAREAEVRRQAASESLRARASRFR